MPDDLAPVVAAVAAGHRRLRATLDTLDDATARRPSRLPRWSIGHVVTHLARNADSFTWILEGCAAGEERVQYPGGNERRNADIESGAHRPAAELAADLGEASDRLDRAFADLPEEAWARQGQRVDGSGFPARSLPLARQREVEVHHVDLGLGYSPADWPDEFVDPALATELDQLLERLAPQDRRDMLAWLLDRVPQPTITLASWQREHRQSSSNST